MISSGHPRTWIERRRARRDADYWIRHGFESRYPWRVEELTGERERRSCARSLRGVIAEVEGRTLPGAAPLRRAALRPSLPILELIERRLESSRPVSAMGMLALDDLLTSADSCLFAPVEQVEDCLTRVLDGLEVQH